MDCSWNWSLTISWNACNPAIASVTVAGGACGGNPVSVDRPLGGGTSTITGTCKEHCGGTARPLILFKDAGGAELGRCELHMACDNCD